MKKTLFTIIIILILLAGFYAIFTVYKNQVGINNPQMTKTSQKEESNKTTAVNETKVTGKVLGLNEKQIAVAKQGGGVETLDISVETPVFKSDGTASGREVIQTDKNVEITYDSATKKVVSIKLGE